jgi:hypothetical protein
MNAFQNDGASTNPTTITDHGLARVHCALRHPPTRNHCVVGIGNVNSGAEHIPVPDSDNSARIDHHVPVEVIRFSDYYPVSAMGTICRPQPATLRKCVRFPQTYLGWLSDPNLLYPAF